MMRENEHRGVVRQLSPHQPRQSSSEGPGPGPANMLRPIMSAPAERMPAIAFALASGFLEHPAVQVSGGRTGRPTRPDLDP